MTSDAGYFALPDIGGDEARGENSAHLSRIHLARGVVFALLYAVFTTAFVLSPYWAYKKMLETQAPVARQIIFAALCVAAAMTWAWLGAGAVSWRFNRRRIWGAVLLLAGLGAVNARALMIDVPYRGDEDVHLRNLARLAEQLTGSGTHVAGMLGMLACIGLFIFAAWKKPKLSGLYIAAALLLAGVEITWIVTCRPVYMTSLTRYPILWRWYSVAPAVLASPFINTRLPMTGHFEEAVYRAAPFLAGVALAFVVFRKIAGRGIASIIAALLFAFAVGTIPLVVYYSSTLYLEMPAVVLMTAALFHGEELIRREPGELTRMPAWYALICVGLIKETTLPFLAAFVICRFACRLAALPRWRREHSQTDTCDFIKLLWDEAAVMICAVLPLALYLFFRKYFGDSRAFAPDARQIFDASMYRDFLRSYAIQFGALLVLSMAGLVILLVQRRFWWVLFLLLAAAMDAGLHFVDQDRFAGHSRFNLFLLPTLIVTAAAAMRWLGKQSPWVAAGAAAAMIAANFVMTPLNPDGTKKVTRTPTGMHTWGDYRFDTAEHNYPYRAALRWATGLGADKILLGGLDYRYESAFYIPSRRARVDSDFLVQDRYASAAREDRAADIEAALKQARANGDDAVIFQLAGNAAPDVADMQGYSREKVFQNDAYTLVGYARRLEGHSAASSQPATGNAHRKRGKSQG